MKRAMLFSLAVLGITLFSGGLGADTIELKNNKKFLKVKVSKEGLQKVEYRKPGLPPQSIDSEKVRTIRYDSGGQEYKSGLAALAERAYIDAAEFFMNVADETSQDVLRAHCIYRAAECLQKAGVWKDSISLFTQFVKENRNHRLYPNALENCAICYLNSRDLPKAEKGFSFLNTKVGELNLSDFWKYSSEYWMIYVKESKQSSQRSLTAYQDLYTKTSKEHPAIANKVRLRIGRVYISSKKYGDALALFNEIIDNRFESDREIVAWAFMSRGFCTMSMAAGMKKGAKAEFKKALYDLLRVVVHYEDVGSPQAEAMFWAGKCFQNLGEDVKDSTKRWRGLYNRIRTEWPGSPFAPDASKELGS